MTGLEEQWAELPRFLWAHIRLTLLALVLGVGFSIPLGVRAAGRPRLAKWVLGAASVLQTIPALALLALMVPLLGGLGAGLSAWGLPAPPTIGFVPAVTALALYSVLPILRNTVTGLEGVDAALREAALGVGMSPRESLRQVELPLALPTIVAGIRTATVWVVGMATLATPVGGTSLGNPIFAGLQTRNLSAVLVGSLAAAGLAIVLDGLVRQVELGLIGRERPRIAVAGGLLLGLAAAALLGVGDGARSAASRTGQPEVRIGSKAFTEQYILAEVLEAALLEIGEPKVTTRPSLGSTVAFDALVAGDLDLYVDYSGTVWATILGRSTIGADRESVLREVETALQSDYGVVLLSRLGFENTYQLVMREDAAAALGIQSVSDLARHAASLEILGDYEFFERPEWSALREGYGMAFARERAMDSTLMYEALRQGSGDVIAAYSTEGRIAAYGLRALEDDRGVIPPYDAIVLASGDFVQREPALAQEIRGLSGRIDAAGMRALNGAVDLDGKSPAQVARAWWRHCGGSPRRPCAAASIGVSGEPAVGR